MKYLDSGATFSPCGTWRYKLWREWGSGIFERKTVGWFLLNPSTADAEQDDPTIRRCVQFSKLWNGTGMVLMNMYGYRATDPRELQRARNRGVDVFGPRNEQVIADVIDNRETDLDVAGWGTHGHAGATDKTMWGRRILPLMYEDGEGLHALGLNKDGSPVHPLYQPYRGCNPPPRICDFRSDSAEVRSWLSLVR